jgi:hypothetical protein
MRTGVTTKRIVRRTAMGNQETQRPGDQEGEGTATQQASILELCQSCCGKAAMPADILKVFETMPCAQDMAKRAEGVKLPADMAEKIKTFFATMQAGQQPSAGN